MSHSKNSKEISEACSSKGARKGLEKRSEGDGGGRHVEGSVRSHRATEGLVLTLSEMGDFEQRSDMI